MENGLDADERVLVTKNLSDIVQSLSSNNEEESCKCRVVVVDEQKKDAKKVSDLQSLVAKPRKQRVGQLDDVCVRSLILNYNPF